MIWLIAIYNNFSYSLAVAVLMSSFIKSSKTKFIVSFLLIFFTGMILHDAQHLIIPVIIPMSTICHSTTKASIPRTLYLCLTAVFVNWYLIALSSSFVMLVVPLWHGSLHFNLFMGALVLIISLIIKIRFNGVEITREPETVWYAVVLELLVLLFFSLVLPQYFEIIAAHSKRQWGIFSLCFLLFLLGVGLLYGRIKDLEHKHKEIRKQCELQLESAQHTQKQFEITIALKHYYSRLFHSMVTFIREGDMPALRQYFERYVAPIHKKYIESENRLDKLENTLLRGLLDSVIGQLSILDTISLDLTVDEEVPIPAHMEMNLFEIMSILLDNALDELRGQASGLLRIELQSTRSATTIIVANTLYRELNIESLYNQERRKGDVHGYGLKRVREIVYTNPCMEHFTYKKGAFENKDILVQQVIINTERRDSSV